MKEVAPGIFRITERKNGKFVKFPVNVYVIAGKDGLVFDAGFGASQQVTELVRKIREVENRMRERGRPCNITRALSSHGHWDHFSGLPHLHQRLGLQMLATRRMLHSMGSAQNYRRSFAGETAVAEVPPPPLLKCWREIRDFSVDFILFHILSISFPDVTKVAIIAENTTLIIDDQPWEVISAPGHCDDDIVLFHRDRGLLLGGDILLRKTATWLGPPRSHLATYLQTLEKLSRLPGLKQIFPAHGGVINGDPYTHIASAIEHRKKRTQEVLNIIRRAGTKGTTFPKILKTIYPSLWFYQAHLVRGWILVTISYLLDAEQIRVRVEGRKKIFTAA